MRPGPDPVKRGHLFLLDKPGGLTSHDVVERVRKATGVARIGHSGTLDPMATGLLLLCAGGAARLQGFFTLMDKTYEGTIRLGRATATYDREGEAVGPDRDASGVTAAQVADASAAFRGEFLQSPPPYSAKKVGGRKFYEMARKGEAVPSLPKKVRVSSLSTAACPLRSRAPRAPTSARSRASSAKSSAAGRTWRPSDAPASASFAPRTP